MNVFVIPSWYPSKEFPVQGIFCKEQSLAMAALRPEWNVAISCWGQEAYHLPFKKPHHWPRRLWAFLQHQRSGDKKLAPNAVEYHTPILHWNERLIAHRRYMQNILDANARHFLKAREQFGPIAIIHAHVAYPGGVIARALSQKFSVPYVITEHTGPFPSPDFMASPQRLKDEIQAAYLDAQTVIGMSPYQVEKLNPWMPNATLLPNCVDARFFEAATESSGAFFTLASVLCPEKGIDDLLHAIHLAKQVHGHTFPEHQFRIAGKDVGHVYRQMSQQLGIEKEVLWLGEISRSEVLKEFQSCQAFILPSHQESFGMVFAEALACGKPVLATRCGGAEYIVEEGQGLLVTPKDREGLAKALITFATAPSDMAHSGKIRQRAKERFSQEAFVNSLEAIYTPACLRI